jgi:hypothetical protein
MVVAATQPEAWSFIFAAIWVALGIRIWIRWGWEERFSIPACFVAAALSVAFGLGLL